MMFTMASSHNPKARFGMTLQQAHESAARFALTNAPPLPAVNFAAVGKTAPGLAATSAGSLPKASAVIITWADAEWAAMQQVFCGSGNTMPYSDRTRGTWPAWQKFSSHLPAGAPSSWTYWGYYRLVTLGTNPVLLFKSNTHLDYPGAAYLQALIQLLVEQVKPNLILSIGTAGGTKPTDHIGSVRAVSAGTLFEAGKPQASWPVYENAWKGGNAVLGNANFDQLLFPVPTRSGDLQTFCAQFNQLYKTSYTLAQLDPDGLNLGDPSPQIDNQTGTGASLLTTPTFVVGTTSGNYQTFTAIEMDDAVIGKACAASKTAFGFVRNLSDPVQNAALPASAQGHWGSAVYDAYGFYSSYNGAVAAWAMLA
jgi:nucleoside phosphorylase